MMEGWKEYKLEDLTEKIVDCEHKTAPVQENGYPSIRTPNIGKGRLLLEGVNRVSYKTYKAWTKRAIPKHPDLILAREAPLGNISQIPKDLDVCLGQRTVLISPNLLKVSPSFLCYRVLSEDVQHSMHSRGGGSTVPHLNVKEIRNLPITIPPLPTQRKIAKILSAYDDLIENNLKRIKLLEEMAQKTYEEWFVRMKFPGHETAKYNKETGLPEGWRKVKLGEVCEFNYGKALKANDRNSGQYPVYGSAGIIGWHNKAICKGEGIIVGRKGNVGSVYWSQLDFYPIDTSYYVTSEIPLQFIYFLIKHIPFINNDAAVPGLNRNAAYLMKCILPKRDLIDEFSSSIARFFKQIQILQIQNQRLKEARDILLPRLMTGMIDPEEILGQVVDKLEIEL